MRLKESLEHRVHLCALSELGTDVICDMKPLLISENIEPLRNQGRTHFISFLYRYELVEVDSLRNLDQLEIQNHLGWFDRILDSCLGIQLFYKSKLEEVLEMEKNNAI